MVQDVEQFLDRVHKHTRTKGQGYHVFREMEPCFRLLVCSFPHIEASKRKQLDDHFRDSFRLRDKLKKSKKKDQVSQISDNHKNRKESISKIARLETKIHPKVCYFMTLYYRRCEE